MLVRDEPYTLLTVILSLAALAWLPVPRGPAIE